MSGILVTGAGGMLGRDVMRAAASAGVEAHGMTRTELDITDRAAVTEAIGDLAPSAIVNCAAWTDVDGAEEHEAEALAINGDGARFLAEAGPRLIHVSTDYVFPGDREEPWGELDPVDPQSAYGRTKLAGERAVAAADPGHRIVRTAWLFGLDGNNFVETMLRLAAERGAVSVVDDQRGCPTFTGHLARALVELASDAHAGGVHHCAGAGETTWFGFAQAIFERTGTECDLTPTTSTEFVRPAKRPANSVLAVTRSDTPRLPDWREGLDDYIAARSVAAGGNQ